MENMRNHCQNKLRVERERCYVYIFEYKAEQINKMTESIITILYEISLFPNLLLYELLGRWHFWKPIHSQREPHNRSKCDLGFQTPYVDGHTPSVFHRGASLAIISRLFQMRLDRATEWLVSDRKTWWHYFSKFLPRTRNIWDRSNRTKASLRQQVRPQCKSFSSKWGNAASGRQLGSHSQ